MKRWYLSIFFLSLFLVAKAQESAQIVACEYWLDGDFSSRQVVSVSGEDVSFAVDASNLSAGVHTLYYRVKDGVGRYTPPLTWLFIKHYNDDQVYSDISELEYWLDGDFSSRQVVSVSGEDVSFAVDASNLSTGVHTLYYRVKDDVGRYTPPLTWLFIKHYNDDQVYSDISELEYWLDGDFSSRQVVSVSGEDVSFAVDASNLSSGVHTLYYRVKDGVGRYTPPLTWLFIKHYNDDKTIAEIKEVEYWIDGEIDKVKKVKVKTDSLSFAVDASKLEPGMHILYLRVCDEKNVKSAPLSWAFYKDYERASNISWYKCWWNNHQDKAERVVTKSEDEEYVFSKQIVVPEYAKIEGDSVLKVANFYIQFGNNVGYVTAVDTIEVPINEFVKVDDQGVIYTLNEEMDAFEVSGYSETLVSDVVIPETLYSLPVNVIRKGALSYAEVLRSIIVPASVTTVGEDVFSGCNNLLVVEWNATAQLSEQCFDDVEEHGNMLIFTNRPVDFKGNVIVDGVAEKIILKDRLPFRNPKNFTARHVSFVREFNKRTKVGISGGWEGMVLPFDVQTITSEIKGAMSPFGSSAEGLPFWLAEWQDATSSFAFCKDIFPNKPFLMEVPNSEDYEDEFNIEGKVTFAADNTIVRATIGVAEEESEGYSLRGSYEGDKGNAYVYVLNDEEYIAADGLVFMPGGAFVSGMRDVRPFESYIYNSQVARAKYLPVFGYATGIEEPLINKSLRVDVYNLQGIRIKSQILLKDIWQELQKGIYIINGRKVIIR